MPDPPLITFSTGNAFYYEDLLDRQPPNDIAEWRASRVIFAEITPTASAFTIYPVLDCGLSEYPLSPIIEMIVPETGMTVECHEPTLTVSVMRMSPIDGTRSKFYLRFDGRLDFWSFMETMSQLKSEEETHLANMMSHLMRVRDTVPTHVPGQSCENGAHSVDAAGREMVGGPASDVTLTP